MIIETGTAMKLWSQILMSFKKRSRKKSKKTWLEAAMYKVLEARRAGPLPYNNPHNNPRQMDFSLLMYHE